MDMLEKRKPARKEGVYDPDSGTPPPQDIDGGSVTPSKPKPKASKPKAMATGGYVKAADGCAQRGKTRGKMV
jgi:hypothetical protein